MKKILVTGGCGYVGSKLTKKLLGNGFHVTVIDTCWFGCYLDPSENLNILQKDIRNIEAEDLKNHETIIHLANIANDPAVEMSPVLSWEVNVLAGYKLIDFAVRAGAKQFIYASSGSVYGVKSEDKVTEDLELVPISAYNKTKMIAERVFKSFEDDIVVHQVRPATVCGVSPRMRLDVAVNILTMQALTTGEIKVFGGEQNRPHIHIDDMVEVYMHFIANSDIESGAYNAGFQSLSINELASVINNKIGCSIKVKESNDPRSYNQCSDKLLASGFKPQKTVSDAVDDIIRAYQLGTLRDNVNWHTVEKMKRIKIK